FRHHRYLLSFPTRRSSDLDGHFRDSGDLSDSLYPRALENTHGLKPDGWSGAGISLCSSGKSFPMASHGIVAHCECCTLYFWSADLPPNGEAFRRHYLTCSQSSRSSTCQRNTCCPAIRSEVACEKCWSEH